MNKSIGDVKANMTVQVSRLDVDVKALKDSSLGKSILLQLEFWFGRLSKSKQHVKQFYSWVAIGVVILWNHEARLGD